MSIGTSIHNVTSICIGERKCHKTFYTQDIDVTHTLAGRQERFTLTLYAESEENLAEPDLSAFDAEDVLSIIRKEAA